METVNPEIPETPKDPILPEGDQGEARDSKIGKHSPWASKNLRCRWCKRKICMLTALKGKEKTHCVGGKNCPRRHRIRLHLRAGINKQAGDFLKQKKNLYRIVIPRPPTDLLGTPLDKATKAALTFRGTLEQILLQRDGKVTAGGCHLIYHAALAYRALHEQEFRLMGDYAHLAHEQLARLREFQMKMSNQIIAVFRELEISILDERLPQLQYQIPSIPALPAQ